MRHGTRYAWFQGCRCEDCRQGRLAEDRARRQRRKDRAAADPTTIPHGDWGYGDYGCRCAVCVEAHTARQRRRLGSQPRRTWTEEQKAEALRLYATQGTKAAMAAAGASKETVRKWARDAGVTCFRPQPAHGRRSTYDRHGCRCPACVQAFREDTARAKQRMHANKANAPHGTSSGYANWGCRCAPCRAAGSEWNRATRLRALARQKAS